MTPALFFSLTEIGLGLAILVVGASALRKNPRNQINQVFAVVATLLFLWPAVGGLNRFLVAAELYVTDVFLRLSECFILWAGLFLINFANIFPGRAGRRTPREGGHDRRRRFTAILFALTIAVIALCFLNFTRLLIPAGSYNPVTGSFSGTWGPLFYVNRLIVALCLAIAVYEQRRFLLFHTRDPRRIHSRYFIYGGLAALAGAILVYGFTTFYGLREVYPAALALICFLWVLLLFKILSYRSIALRGSLFRNMGLLLGAGILLAPVVFLINYLIGWLSEDSPWLLASVIGLLFVAFYRVATKLLPRLTRMVQGTARLDEALTEYNAKILDLRSEADSDVRARLVHFLTDLYHPRFLAFYEAGSDEEPNLTQVRTLTRIADVESIPPIDFPAELRDFLMQTREESRAGGLLVDLQARADSREAAAASRALSQFAAFGAEALIPFYDYRDEAQRASADIESELPSEATEEVASESDKPLPHPIHGVLLMGLARGDRPFDHTDLRLLLALRAPTMLAMNNQQLLHSTTRLQEKLEEENKRITKRLARDLPGADRTAPAAAFVYDPAGPMGAIIAQLERFAQRDGAVLITGETGTGKEQLARMLHAESAREGKLVPVNCSAIPGDLIENELFGHVKGAFTGADSDSEGLVARAQDGTLFLDEIGDMPLTGQVKLLRLVQEGVYEKVGSSEPIRTTARFVFATNRDLETETEAGRFRSDLFYRISTFEIRILPLRERRADIPLLIRHFLTVAAERFDRKGLHLSPEAEALLHKHNWPGNVRELENLIMRSVVLSDGELLDTDSLPVMFKDEVDFDRKQRQLERIVQEQARLEKELLLEALEQCGGNQRRAAEILKISRGSLQYRMKQYGLASK